MSKTVLITGAQTGIGRATALAFHKRGYNVAATMLDPGSAEGWAPSGMLRPYLDVTDADSVDRALAETRTRFGPLDVLVNNAGYAQMGPLEGVSDELWRRQFEVNLFGAAATIRAVLPEFRARRSGVIVNVSSMGGRMSYPLGCAYHASKWALEGLSESLQFEVRSHGVRVKVIEPGGVRTDFISKGVNWARHPAYDAVVDATRDMSLKLDQRLGKPERVADTIVRAAEDRSYRLRYPVLHQPYAFVRAVLPDAAWLRVAGAVLERQSRRPGASVSA